MSDRKHILTDVYGKVSVCIQGRENEWVEAKNADDPKDAMYLYKGDSLLTGQGSGVTLRSAEEGDLYRAEYSDMDYCCVGLGEGKWSYPMPEIVVNAFDKYETRKFVRYNGKIIVVRMTLGFDTVPYLKLGNVWDNIKKFAGK